MLGSGAFGITYLVTDTLLGTPFALKEYLPRDLVRRLPAAGPTAHPVGHDGQHGAGVEIGRASCRERVSKQV